MSYQVLARKWRPKTFEEMVGQEHVLKALVNALDENRLHHAYLFTGTRGVGKTSLARLFAKSLNCEQGVSSLPCGCCSACKEIAEGRFVDLLEVDAASRTKVEDTRELLENVQYAPTHGRFKVYLIDEVHMLSSHSFNALLKTLEEPPPHVKFLLATTDPQKLPVTILSRCLQFNLKNLTSERIVGHLGYVLKEEGVAYDDPSLWLLARSADGSMRDALSLTDQAIAFGAGALQEADVRNMLGTIDQKLVYSLLQAIITGDGLAVLSIVKELAQFSPDFRSVLADLINLLHRIAIAQVVPAAVDNSLGDRDQVIGFAGRISAEELQLFYQIALTGRRDLQFAPDLREGFEMSLLRMLAFRPADRPPSEVETKLMAEPASPRVNANAEEVPASNSKVPNKTEQVERVDQQEVQIRPPVQAYQEEPPPWDEEPFMERSSIAEDSYPTKKSEPLPTEQPKEERPLTTKSTAVGSFSSEPAGSLGTQKEPSGEQEWPVLCGALPLSGMTASLAQNLSMEHYSEHHIRFHFTKEQRTLLSETQRSRIVTALNSYLSTEVQVEFIEAAQTMETPAQYAGRLRVEQQQAAIKRLQEDPVVVRICDYFDATLDKQSVKPLLTPN